MTYSDRLDHPLNRHRKESVPGLIKEWNNLYNKNNTAAVASLNDASLDFPTFYVLKKEIKEKQCHNQLNDRNKLAMDHIENNLYGKNLGIQKNCHFTDQHYLILATFRWMLNTGAEAHITPAYTKVIDAAAIQMLLTYQQDVSKDFVDLIFYRRRHKSQHHYLIAALQEFANPNSLIFIANYLLSDHHQEVMYAAQLLHFIPDLQYARSKYEAFQCFEKWFELNGRYLVSTGENNDVSPAPQPYKVNLAAKYLGKCVAVKTGEPLQALSNFENNLWQQFLLIPASDQEKLAGLSTTFRINDRNQWTEWLASPIQSQLTSLKQEG